MFIIKAEYTGKDFDRCIRNPYFEKLNKKTEIPVRHEIYQIFYEVGEQNGVEPEVIMSRCLTDYAMKLRDDE